MQQLNYTTALDIHLRNTTPFIKSIMAGINGGMSDESIVYKLHSLFFNPKQNGNNPSRSERSPQKT